METTADGVGVTPVRQGRQPHRWACSTSLWQKPGSEGWAGLLQVLAEAGPALLAYRKQLLQSLLSFGKLFLFSVDVGAQPPIP